MPSILPPFPKFVFTVLEPLSLAGGALLPWIAPEWFIAEQSPMSVLEPVSGNAKTVANQLGNMFLLVAMLGIATLTTSTEPKVIRNFVLALWLADIGHVGFTCVGIGYEKLVDVANWNAITWGNIGATVFLFLTRSGYLLGVFGPDRVPALLSKKQR